MQMEEKGVCVHCIHDHSCALFLGEWDCVSTGCISQYMQSLQDMLSFIHIYYFCLSFPWRVSGSCAFHADICSLWNKKGEAKKRRVKTYMRFDISHCDSFPCPCSCVPSTVTCWRLASSQESERTPGHEPGPSTQAVAHQIKTTH